MLLHTIGNFERISDHACNLTDAARQMYEKKLEFSDKAKKELDVLQAAVMRIVNISFDSFEKKDEKEIISSFTCHGNDSNNVCWLWYTGIQRFQER